MIPREPYVVLSEEDYVQARDGNRREDYRSGLAQASKMLDHEALAEVKARARALGEPHPDPWLMLAIVRKLMLERYEALEREGAA
ncbi:MAG TPA: hypothetical protein VGB13_04670 [Candidatus Krumholzibacteria bacterium]